MTEQKPIDLGKYLDYKLFDFMRKDLIPIVNSYRGNGTDKDLYKHLFMAPASVSNHKAFQLNGVLSPYICIWPTTPLNFNDNEGGFMYGRTVLPRDFKYFDEAGDLQVQRGFLYDFKRSYDIVASSYYKPFVNTVNQLAIEFDRLRYHVMPINEIMNGQVTNFELKLMGLAQSEAVDEATGNRAFTMNCKYDLSITLPLKSLMYYLEGVEIYLNDNKVWEFHNPTPESNNS